MERLRKVAALNREITVLKSQLQSQQRADQVERERAREVAALNGEISSLRLELADQRMVATSRQKAGQRMQEESQRAYEKQLYDRDRYIVALKDRIITNAEVTEKKKDDHIRSLEKKLEWITQQLAGKMDELKQMEDEIRWLEKKFGVDDTAARGEDGKS